MKSIRQLLLKSGTNFIIRIFEVQQDVLQKIQNESLIQGLTRGRIESAIMIDLLLT